MALHVPAGKVRDIYDHIACGGKPDADDLAQIPAHRHAVLRQEVKQIHALKAAGHNQDARALAMDFAARMLDNMPEDFEPPTPNDDLPDDPRALAARIRRY